MAIDSSLLDEIVKTLQREKKRHPNWPVHLVAQAAQVAYPAGEILRQASEIKYHIDNQDGYNDATRIMKNHAILTAVNAIRFLENLK